MSADIPRGKQSLQELLKESVEKLKKEGVENLPGVAKLLDSSAKRKHKKRVLQSPRLKARKSTKQKEKLRR